MLLIRLKGDKERQITRLWEIDNTNGFSYKHSEFKELPITSDECADVVEIQVNGLELHYLKNRYPDYWPLAGMNQLTLFGCMASNLIANAAIKFRKD